MNQPPLNDEYTKVTHVWTRGHGYCGEVSTVSNRYCAGCGRNHTCLVVKWPSGYRSKPCTSGMKFLSDTEMEII